MSTRATNVKSSNQSIPTQRSDNETLSTPGLKAFSCNDFATGIKYSHNLTEGGESGIVFKGWIDKQTLCPSAPETGIPVSLKHLKSEGFKGDKEWLKKLNYIGQLHHPNLVKLFGYRVDSEDWFLVYEFLPNGSLENYLFRVGIQPISWETRMKVAIGAAKGLSFLHH
ncbi:probable serine/threonine-protein kinase PBL3 [Chenopodium quinoa]|uniref:probable serine/threonine-protein kinase PBL3 n=1 Tax=Chenopodium quinoa TaxID=63459 RepID=UPI000B791A8B|nr:probable serine/threonine-protein kinase PBL3 [Chenopodium quinoa]